MKFIPLVARSWQSNFVLSDTFRRRFLRTIFCISLCLCASPSNAATAESVAAQLLGDIKKSHLQLQKNQRVQLAERQKISKKLQAVETEVSSLRQQAATMQRLADEKTLALDELEDRLSNWREQNDYQAYALAEYLRDQIDTIQSHQLPDMLGVLLGQLERHRQALSPRWQDQQIINTEGQLQQTQVLQLGPVSWALDSTTQTGGLLDRQEIPTITLAADTTQAAAWLTNQQQGQGILHLDPTLSRAIKMAQERETVAEHIGKGGVWAMPILAFGAIALTCAIGKAWQLYRLPGWLPGISARAKNAFNRGDQNGLRGLTEQCSGSQCVLLSISLNETQLAQREDALFNHLTADKHKLEKWLGTIAIIASVAPLLGLLGTVSGMIKTFKLMTIFGSGDASAVSGGISEALITTELGLIVAIPALLLHAILQRWVKQQLAQTEAFAIELSQLQLSSDDTHTEMKAA